MYTQWVVYVLNSDHVGYYKTNSLTLDSWYTIRLSQSNIALCYKNKHKLLILVFMSHWRLNIGIYKVSKFLRVSHGYINSKVIVLFFKGNRYIIHRHEIRLKYQQFFFRKIVSTKYVRIRLLYFWTVIHIPVGNGSGSKVLLKKGWLIP